MYSVNFTCTNGRPNKSNLNKITVWINVDGERATTMLDLKVEPEEFKKAICSPRSNYITRYCSDVRRRIDDYYTILLEKGLRVRAADLADYVRNGYQVRNYMLYQLFDDFIKIERQKVGNDIGTSTYRKYLLAIEQFKKVIQNKPLKAVNNADVLSYKYHLVNDLKLKNSTLCSYLTKTKSIFVFAVRNEQLTQNPFDTIKIRKSEVEINPLTKEELMSIANKDFGITRLNQVRDVFVFAANTALSYVDLASITAADIQTEGNVKFLKKRRAKTGVTYILPLNETAVRILEKYNYELPVVSNQKYNAYLKEIADICRIKKPLTTHIARHTAATLMLNAGIPIEVVSKILGHSNTKMTQHYAKLLDKTVINTKIEF